MGWIGLDCGFGNRRWEAKRVLDFVVKGRNIEGYNIQDAATADLHCCDCFMGKIILALTEVLNYRAELDSKPVLNVTVYSDSTYAISCMTEWLPP